MNWYLDVLKKYVEFNGRARRKEYWMFCLFNVVISVVLALIDSSGVTGGMLGGLYSLAVLLPALGVTIRRLHDIGKSGWWLLIILIPIIGAIVLLVFMVIDSQLEENQYGPNPKAA